MKIKTAIIFSFMLLLSSCGHPSVQNDKQSTVTSVCDALDKDDHYIVLTGTLVINSKDEFVFKGITDDSLGIACPTFLIECGKGLNEYIEGVYDGYSSVKNIRDNFWITITGKYINMDEYKNQNSDFEQLEFMYNHVSIVNDPDNS